MFGSPSEPHCAAGMSHVPWSTYVQSLRRGIGEVFSPSSMFGSPSEPHCAAGMSHVPWSTYVQSRRRDGDVFSPSSMFGSPSEPLAAGFSRVPWSTYVQSLRRGGDGDVFSLSSMFGSPSESSFEGCRWPTIAPRRVARISVSFGTFSLPGFTSTQKKLSPRWRRDDMPPADGTSTRGGSTSVRGRIRSPHISDGRPAAGSQRA